MISERGVGKTSAYQQSAAELDIDYIGLYTAAMEGPAPSESNQKVVWMLPKNGKKPAAYGHYVDFEM